MSPNRDNLAKKIIEKAPDAHTIIDQYQKIDPETFAIVEQQVNEIIARAKQVLDNPAANAPPLKLTYGGQLVKRYDARQEIKQMGSLYELFYLGSCL